jgi:ureidoglycolate dehydrogenase (NAD+)
VKTSVPSLERLCRDALAKAGVGLEEARMTADVLVTTDTWGVHTHGTKQLRGLLKNFRDGKMTLGASAELVAQGASWALFDGHRALPMPASQLAMRTAMEKARSTGIAIAGMRNSGHFGAAGYYAVMAARQGMIGLAMCNVDPGVAAPGSRGPVLGTNPLAWAAPTGNDRPLFLDIATSVVAAGKVYQAQAAGKAVPEGWLIDGDGLPTTDPTGYPLRGALLPMAGHKGYGISLLIEILTGVLSGGAFGNDVVSWVRGQTPVNQSLSFIAVDAGAFMSAAVFAGRVDTLASSIRGAPRAVNADRILLPGEREWQNREKALREGLVLPADVAASLLSLCSDLAIDVNQYIEDR